MPFRQSQKKAIVQL